MRHSKKILQDDFWHDHPCGIKGSFLNKVQHRYRMEPWLRAEMNTLPLPERSIKFLEIGCGQAVDAFLICSKLRPGSEYTGIDYSSASIAECKKSTKEARKHFPSPVNPKFQQADASSLPFKDNTFDFTYSIGVLHHMRDPRKAINEMNRVLKVSGQGVVGLYRKGSLKIIMAKMLRGVQHIIDKVTGQKFTIYQWIKKNDFLRPILGTMLHECFGIPYMHCYTKNELKKMFWKFRIDSIERRGFNIPRLKRIKTKKAGDAFGYFYLIKVTKK
jgi:ubiquinone/menaquinone biosynthesis C-methylase UbiE